MWGPTCLERTAYGKKAGLAGVGTCVTDSPVRSERLGYFATINTMNRNLETEVDHVPAFFLA